MKASEIRVTFRGRAAGGNFELNRHETATIYAVFPGCSKREGHGVASNFSQYFTACMDE